MPDNAVTETAQYLTFTLDGELFAMDIVKVREVLDYTGVTRVPRTPDFVLGVINLRGHVVPVVDLRIKFGLPASERTESCIIIAEVTVDDETTVLGALADSVQEVLELSPEQIEPAPRIGCQLDTELILGMGTMEDRLMVILNADKVFSSVEVTLLRDSAAEPALAANC
ncbi:chemotaxis protein CheW [Geomonas sp. Red32]|uniref:chemotaxis protein CheW n=1 Tax=Geomonas sp. Red32 TaxID=2912856 RepID=UPI00202CF2E0|nr:chemotaxis protein CheW [Geomonas sp. Red32]MCM0083188.1 chemotaxis protein CheW [Geomonas sp. Red32]